MCHADKVLVSQTTRTGGTTQDIVDQCVEFHLSYLPQETSNIVSYIPAASEHNPSYLFDIEFTTEQFNQKNHDFRKNHEAFFDCVRAKTWTILPLGVNGHFTVVIMHAIRVPMPGTRLGFRMHIQNVVVADPQRNAQLEQYIYQRLEYVFTNKRGFRFDKKTPVKLWFPKQDDRLTCGLRVYEIIRVMLMRISQSAAEVGLKDGCDPDTIWQDLSGMSLQIHTSSSSFDLSKSHRPRCKMIL